MLKENNLPKRAISTKFIIQIYACLTKVTKNEHST